MCERFDIDLDELRAVTGFSSSPCHGPVAAAQQWTVAVIRVLDKRLRDLGRGERPDIADVADAVDELLDRSVGAEGVRDSGSQGVVTR